MSLIVIGARTGTVKHIRDTHNWKNRTLCGQWVGGKNFNQPLKDVHDRKPCAACVKTLTSMISKGQRGIELLGGLK